MNDSIRRRAVAPASGTVRSSTRLLSAVATMGLLSPACIAENDPHEGVATEHVEVFAEALPGGDFVARTLEDGTPIAEATYTAADRTLVVERAGEQSTTRERAEMTLERMREAVAPEWFPEVELETPSDSAYGCTGTVISSGIDCVCFFIDCSWTGQDYQEHSCYGSCV